MQNTGFPASQVYPTTVHRAHILNIGDEGSDQAICFFPLEVFAVEAFYIVGYNLAC